METELLGRLQVAMPRNKWRVQDYIADFSWLWDIEPRESHENGVSTEGSKRLEDWLADGTGEKNLLIVWDGMPSLDISPINITNHLTPMDWALSLSHRLLSDPKELPDLRIVILDCCSRSFPDAYGCRMVDSLLATLPWFGVIRLLPHGPRRSLANQGGADWLKHILVDDTSAYLALREVGRVKASKAVDALVHAWLGDLAHSATHHDVNNLLGPLILLEAFNQNSGNYELGRIGLLQHARWLGIAPPTQIDIGASGAWIDAQSLADELNRTIRFIVVDDQVNNGWKDVIAAALGFPSDLPIPQASANELLCLAKNGHVELWAAMSADPIVAKLDKALNSGSFRDMRFGLQITESDGSDHGPPMEVLLLDLRLAADENKEKQYFRAAGDLAGTLHKRNADDRWPWRALDEVQSGAATSKSSFHRTKGGLVEEYAKNSDIASARGENAYLRLLTLLPRVLATMDMSLPIVIFSSTGQRSVTEQLKDYGNIITAFEKPRFASYGSSDIFLEAKAGFTEAMGKAADILRARLAVQNVRTGSAQTAACVSSDKDKKHLIELFLDETGDEFSNKGSVTVVGILVVGPTDAVQQFKAAVEEKISAIRATAPRNFEKQKEQLTNNAEKLAKCVEENCALTGVYASLVSLTGRSSDGDALVGELENEFKADNLYRGILSALIEISVYHLAAEICSEVVDAEYKVYMATRVKRGTEADQQDAWERWGIEATYVGAGGGLWNAIDRLSGVVRNDGDELIRQVVDILTGHGTSKLIDDGPEKKAAYPKTRRIRYVDFAAARPIVQSVSQHYRNSKKFRPRPEHARAYGLNHPDRWTRPFHLLADSLTSRGASGETIARLNLAGFAGEYSIELRTLLYAARQVTNSFVGDGLATAARCGDVATAVIENDVRRRLLGRLAMFTTELSGIEFMRMVHSIRNSGDWSREDGMITWIGEGTCSILMPNGDQAECPQFLRLNGSEVCLIRGDFVSVYVRRERTTDRTEVVFKKLIQVSRHPKWNEFQKGERIMGNIGAINGVRGEVAVRAGEIDGFVPVARAPSWRIPPRGTSLEFDVDEVDPLNARLVLLPVF